MASHLVLAWLTPIKLSKVVSLSDCCDAFNYCDVGQDNNPLARKD